MQHSEMSHLRTASSSSSEQAHAIQPIMLVHTLHDFQPDNNETGTYLPFKASVILRVYNREPSGWWDGELMGRRGWFPSNYVAEVELDANGVGICS